VYAALPLGAAKDVVRGHAEQAGNDLGESEGLAVALLARVSGEQLDRVISDLSVGIELELERRWEAFELGIAGLASDDERNDWTIGMPRFEEPHLLVDVAALGGGRRANDDQRNRGVERGKRLLIQAMARGEVIAVAENWAERRGDRTRRGLATHEALVDGEGFERAVQPLRPRGVGMAI
jgi:hypothetical protein